MSIRSEQYRSLLQTRQFLYDLLSPVKTKRIPKEIRNRASNCLRHFPLLDKDGKPLFSQDPFSP